MTRDRFRRCAIAGVLAAMAFMFGVLPAVAQTFITYRCGATPVVVAFFPEERNVRIQLDGHSMTLKQRLSASGTRFSTAGVALWIKGKTAMLKRRGQRWIDCASE